MAGAAPGTRAVSLQEWLSRGVGSPPPLKKCYAKGHKKLRQCAQNSGKTQDRPEASKEILLS